MTAFAIAAALVAAAAVALALRPLWSRRRGTASRRELSLAVYRDQLRELDADLAAGTLARGDYDRARMELEKRALEDVQESPPGAERPARPGRDSRRGALWALLAFPVVALGVYVAVGDPRGLDPAQREGPTLTMQDIEGMVQRLADRLEQNPDDVEGWRMLGRSYSVMGRFAEAANAYSRAAARAPRDAQLLADLADALAMARGQNLQGEPEELVQRALQIDPQNLKALALAGTAAFTRGDYRGAERFWQRMVPLLPPDSEDARTVESNIAEARTLAAGKAGERKPAPEKAAAAAVSGTVSLSPQLASNAAPDDTVFIFARAPEGPPLPLAVVRKKVRDLPARFTLDDSMAMSPAAKLSAYPRVVVVARVSKGGTPTAAPGDLQGTSAAVANTARGVEVVIDATVR
jgi:cytochrome c-type biogenesis protein CcmH